jgi:hypothetical protein
LYVNAIDLPSRCRLGPERLGERTAPANGVQYANRSAVWMSVDIWIVGPALERALVATALRILART